MDIKQTNGRLVLSEIAFKEYMEKKVIKNNETSCKITVPKSWEGKKVYVILAKEND